MNVNNIYKLSIKFDTMIKRSLPNDQNQKDNEDEDAETIVNKLMGDKSDSSLKPAVPVTPDQISNQSTNQTAVQSASSSTKPLKASKPNSSVKKMLDLHKKNIEAGKYRESNSSASPAILQALSDADDKWPERNRASDGTMGDARHQARKSDHNVGNAVDITHDPSHGVNGDEISSLATRDPRVKYVIWNRKIWTPAKGWGPYKIPPGGDPHDHHVHISVFPEKRSDTSPWPWADSDYSKIAALANVFYRVAVPLDDVLVAPGRYEKIHPTEPTAGRSKLDLDTGERVSYMDLPPLTEFEKHYGRTSILYRIIYVDHKFGLFGGVSTKIPECLKLIKTHVENAKKYKNNKKPDLSGEISEEEVDEIISQGEFLLRPGTFNPNAINILANAYDVMDLTGPLGVDHDLGHTIIGSLEITKLLEKLIDIDLRDAILLDYEIIHCKKGKKQTEALTLLSDSQIESILASIFFSGEKMPGSISELNLNKKILEDLIPDILPMYNSRGESLSGIELRGVPIYRAEHDPLSRTEPKEKDFYTAIAPKDPSGAIPHVKEVIEKNIIPSFEKKLKNELKERVGKVILLWS